MNELEKTLLREALGEAEPKICLRTKTEVDAGRWLRKVPLWLCITDDRLVLLAVGRRMYLGCVPLTDCVGSAYCHATGELVIRPVEGLEFDHVVMSPGDALKVLSQIEAGARGSLPENAVEVQAAANDN